jgi:enoyl-CoA hydratase
MPYETILVEKTGHLATVTFNRPHILNALNNQVFLDLEQILAAFRGDSETRFIIFTGAGRTFSAGVEFTPQAIAERFTLPGRSSIRLWDTWIHSLMLALENLEQVTVAAINGPAMGGAMALAMNCDFRIASDTATLGIPETKLGVFFTWGATPRLASLVGPAKAKELIMVGDSISAMEALSIGLVNKIVPAPELMGSCRELVDKLSRRGPLALRMCKKMINAASSARMEDLYVCEPEMVERLHLSGEPAEGGRAFLEKRAPRFGQNS